AEAEAVGAIRVGWQWFGGDGLRGFHGRVVGWSFDLQDVSHVPVVEALDGGRVLVRELKGSKYDFNGWRHTSALGNAFCDGAGGEGVEHHGDDEIEQVSGEAEALGRAGLGRRGFTFRGRGSFHTRNVAFFRGCGKGRGD